ncbi:glutamine--fructose-6-phosphate transaminase (isomerizing) [Sansalvadorimonas sp. 2012CJ34-2]|uniref:Glutamine--fructose-6-phosphate aminotransferase [isomerizing] n=1 Tax=Parendozoicomonas callyspongiae TaxID=2942213 RepID=A0ABT0PBK0_9GAMM|nr:glutamine--fructose-6-phosphate transaminase (isomerizing) [Sansalvadorimonas sp. 2012CJ34-2]MCL6268591.1 glutamine--fructose-6-phosphate transaminase (isomerizing) [Sansalvadorimonas sp. 2012CJ34-2]
MCGIVGAVAQRDVAPILIEGLKRLEYRGYDSAGLAVIDRHSVLGRLRRIGKVSQLEDALNHEPVRGGTGIAHTRWATHGEPSERNAHPHMSGDITVVHNGIIENHEELRAELRGKGYVFESETDTEVIAHLIHHERKSSETLLEALQKAVTQLDGAYGTVIMDRNDPDLIVVARSGSPLVIGQGIGENYVGSDQLALLPVTHRFQYLEEGDVAEITRDKVSIFNFAGEPVERELIDSDLDHQAGDKGEFRHFMLKEIFEQPQAIASTLEGRLTDSHVAVEAFGHNAREIFEKVGAVQLIACGTSYNAGMVARNWFEDLGIPCRVEIASEFRYRRAFVPDNCLFVTITQSGETADTLAALRLAKEQGFMNSLTICNVPGSSMVRESDMAFMTRAGAEIGVASTKAFTTQLTALLMLVTAIARSRGRMTEEQESQIVSDLRGLPHAINEVLELKDTITELSEDFADKHHSLFLGRGTMYPIAMEGALKLKEISYIHAEAYAAGELKHGPLALIDSDMPVVVVAPNNELLEKLKSNMEEVRARGGQLYVFADRHARLVAGEGVKVIPLGEISDQIAPILYTIPLQLLSYDVALIKGTDVDQPRNLAKSVTVE